jgi:hypothetical protein
VPSTQSRKVQLGASLFAASSAVALVVLFATRHTSHGVLVGAAVLGALAIASAPLRDSLTVR